MRFCRFHRNLMLPVLGFLAQTISPYGWADTVSNWNAASGLTPEQIFPPYSLSNNAVPEVPVLAGEVLTISTSAEDENMFYVQRAPAVVTSAEFFIEAQVKFVSGSTSSASRAPVFIAATTAPGTGGVLFIGEDEVFFASAGARGPVAKVDTDDSAHTYRLEFDATGTISLFYDGAQLLTGATYSSMPDHGSTERILWGEGSSLATGTSEWQSFRHDAVNPQALDIFRDDFDQPPGMPQSRR